MVWLSIKHLYFFYLYDSNLKLYLSNLNIILFKPTIYWLVWDNLKSNIKKKVMSIWKEIQIKKKIEFNGGLYKTIISVHYKSSLV